MQKKRKRERKIAIVAIDTRIVPLLTDTIRRACVGLQHASGDDTLPMLFLWCGLENEEWVRSSLGVLHPSPNINVLSSTLAPTSPERYSTLLLSPRPIWETLLAAGVTHALFVQADVEILRAPSVAELRLWLRYDYIGAPWSVRNGASRLMRRGVGNGGCSLRSVEACIKVTRNRLAVAKHTRYGWPEDVVFSAFLARSRIASVCVASTFACENVVGHHKEDRPPFALHKPDECCDPRMSRVWRRHCEAFFYVTVSLPPRTKIP